MHYIYRLQSTIVYNILLSNTYNLQSLEKYYVPTLFTYLLLLFEYLLILYTREHTYLPNTYYIILNTKGNFSKFYDCVYIVLYSYS